MFLAIKPRQVIRLRTKREIAKVVHDIVRANDAIPARNQSLVHFLNGGERPVVVCNDVLVAKMVIGREPVIIQFYTPPTFKWCVGVN